MSKKPAPTVAATTGRAVPLPVSVNDRVRYIAIPSNDLASRCQS